MKFCVKSSIPKKFKELSEEELTTILKEITEVTNEELEELLRIVDAYKPNYQMSIYTEALKRRVPPYDILGD